MTRGTASEFVYYCIKILAMEDPREEYEDEHLPDVEKIELERQLLYAAYENSYRVLTSKIPFDELIIQNNLDGLSAIMAYDPIEGIQKKELENIIAYYLGLDEPYYYMRCAELKKILDGLPDEVEL